MPVQNKNQRSNWPITFHLSDGTTVKIYKDGRRIYLFPDGNSRYEKPSGAVTYVFASECNYVTCVWPRMLHPIETRLKLMKQKIQQALL